MLYYWVGNMMDGDYDMKIPTEHKVNMDILLNVMFANKKVLGQQQKTEKI